MVTVVDVGGTSTDKAAAAVYIDKDGRIHLYGVKSRARVLGGSDHTHELLRLALQQKYGDKRNDYYKRIINRPEFFIDAQT